MIKIRDSYAVIGDDRAAASARLLLASPPSGIFGAELCSQHAERFTGRPATAVAPTTAAAPTAVARVRQSWVHVPAMKINKFQFVQGSTVWRPTA